MVILHVLLVIGTGLAVLYSDEQGFEWFLGKQKMLSKKKIDALHAVISLGLAGIILTGGLLLIDRPGFLHDATFITKMVFVAALTLNGLLIGSLTDVAAVKEFKDVPASQRMLLFASGAVSMVGWLGAAICGLLLG